MEYLGLDFIIDAILGKTNDTVDIMEKHFLKRITFNEGIEEEISPNSSTSSATNLQVYCLYNFIKKNHDTVVPLNPTCHSSGLFD